MKKIVALRSRHNDLKRKPVKVRIKLEMEGKESVHTCVLSMNR